MSHRLIDVPDMMVCNVLALNSCISTAPNGVGTVCVNPSAVNPTITTLPVTSTFRGISVEKSIQIRAWGSVSTILASSVVYSPCPVTDMYQTVSLSASLPHTHGHTY